MRILIALLATWILAIVGVAAQTVEVEKRKDGEVRMSHSHNGVRLEVRYRGDVTVADDDLDITQISSDGYLQISEDRRIGADRRLELRSTFNGAPLSRRYFIDDRERAYDPEGKSWLAEVLPSVLRRSGLGAERRVGRILRTQGPSGVLNEISLLESDYVRSLYFRLFLDQANPRGTLLANALVQAGRQIDSDHELAKLLRRAAERAIGDSTAQNAYFDAASSIGSDFELRQVLGAATHETLPATGVAHALRTATSIGSDFELASLLVDIGEKHMLNGTVRTAFFEALSSVESDFEHRRVLASLTKRVSDPATLDAMLASASRIESDFECAQFLIGIARPEVIEGTRNRFFETAKTIGSDHEQRRVLTAVVELPNLSSETLRALLRASTSIGSDYELASVLTRVAERHTLQGSLRDAYLDAASHIGSEHEKNRVLSLAIR